MKTGFDVLEVSYDVLPIFRLFSGMYSKPYWTDSLPASRRNRSKKSRLALSAKVFSNILDMPKIRSLLFGVNDAVCLVTLEV